MYTQTDATEANRMFLRLKMAEKKLTIKAMAELLAVKPVTMSAYIAPADTKLAIAVPTYRLDLLAFKLNL